MDLALNSLQRLICHKTQTTSNHCNSPTNARNKTDIITYNGNSYIAGHILKDNIQMLSEKSNAQMFKDKKINCA